MLLTSALGCDRAKEASKTEAKTETSAKAKAKDATADESKAKGEAKTEIVLHRPFKVGDEYAFEGSGRDDKVRTVLVGGETVEGSTESFTVALKADAIVHEVNAEGQPTRTEFKVRSCTPVDDPSVTLLDEGDVFMVLATDEPGGGNIVFPPGIGGPDMVEHMELLITTNFGPTDDELYGTKGAVSVGDSWSINRKEAAAELSSGSNTATPDQVKGEMTFKGTEDVDGEACQRFSSEMTVTDMDMGTLPPGTKADSVVLTAKQDRVLPVDSSKHSRGGSQEFSLKMVLQMPTESGQMQTVKMERTSKATIKLSPK
ncbi:MAG: hypothetical protein AAF799_30575 [Myxococcota bacterium]